MARTALLLNKRHIALEITWKDFFWNSCQYFLSLYNMLYALQKSYTKQDFIPVGCVPPACCPYLPACTALRGVPASGPRGDVYSQGGVSAQGVSAQGGTCLWFRGGCLPLVLGGGHPLVPGGVCIPACNGADPPMDRMTDTCKNISFANFVCGR